jgi:hypothetical protein
MSVRIPPPPPPPPPAQPPSVVITPSPAPVSEGKLITANRLAYVLVISFFIIAAVPLIWIFGAGSTSDTMEIKTSNAVEWIQAVSAYLAGLVGAVLGYYFRAETEQK